MNICGIGLYFKRNFHAMALSKRFFSILILSSTVCFAQPIHPADSLLSSPNTSLISKIAIAPISLWQRLSYKSGSLNCQFYPSCSNYGAQSIAQHGVILGSALAADRIARCNPMAYHYHIKVKVPLFHNDGRLLNPVPIKLFSDTTGEKSPALASALSTVAPGLGRFYADRTWDGLFGFMTVTALANLTYVNHTKNSATGTVFFGGLTATFYLGEVIGAYRAAIEANNRP